MPQTKGLRLAIDIGGTFTDSVLMDTSARIVANAYIQPLMADYLADFRSRFEAREMACPILMMTAGGGRCMAEE